MKSLEQKGRFQEIPAAMKNIKQLSFYAALFFSGVLGAYSMGMDQYPGYDASMMVNLAYRLDLGQTAPKDFFSPMPPLFSLGCKLAFEIFGRSWYALCLMGAVFYTCAAVFISIISLRITGWWRALLVGIICFFLTGFFYGFWWHNTVTGLVGAMVALQFTSQATAGKINLNLGALCGILLATKPNIAVPMFALIQVWIWAPKRLVGISKAAATGCTLVSILTLTVICYASGQSPIDYISAVADIAAKRAVAPAGILFPSASSIQNYARSVSFYTLALLAALTGVIILTAAALAVRVNRGKLFYISDLNLAISARIYAAIVCLIGTFAGFAFNGDYFHASLPIFAALMAMTPKVEFNTLHRLANLTIRLLAVGLTVILLIYLGIGGVNRDRVYTTGPGAFWEPSSSSIRAKSGFFKGATIGWQLHQFNREVESFLRLHPFEKVFFGPRVEFGYAAFSKEPPKGLPLWFDAQAAWPPGSESEILRNFKAHKFEALIFFQLDTTNMPVGLLEFIDHEYVNAIQFSKFQQATIMIPRSAKK